MLDYINLCRLCWGFHMEFLLMTFTHVSFPSRRRQNLFCKYSPFVVLDGFYYVFYPLPAMSVATFFFALPVNNETVPHGVMMVVLA